MKSQKIGLEKQARPPAWPHLLRRVVAWASRGRFAHVPRPAQGAVTLKASLASPCPIPGNSPPVRTGWPEASTSCLRPALSRDSSNHRAAHGLPKRFRATAPYFALCAIVQWIERSDQALEPLDNQDCRFEKTRFVSVHRFCARRSAAEGRACSDREYARGACSESPGALEALRTSRPSQHRLAIAEARRRRQQGQAVFGATSRSRRCGPRGSSCPRCGRA